MAQTAKNEQHLIAFKNFTSKLKVKEQLINDLTLKQSMLCDFFNWDPALVKSKRLKVPKGPDSLYRGEWCEKTKTPNGRGIVSHQSGNIYIGNFSQGSFATPGRYVYILKEGQFRVGEKYLNSEGKLCDKGHEYSGTGENLNKVYDQPILPR